MAGKGDNPRRYNKELSDNYRSNKFWDNVENDSKCKNKDKNRKDDIINR